MLGNGGRSRTTGPGDASPCHSCRKTGKKGPVAAIECKRGGQVRFALSVLAAAAVAALLLYALVMLPALLFTTQP